MIRIQRQQPAPVALPEFGKLIERDPVNKPITTVLILQSVYSVVVDPKTAGHGAVPRSFSMNSGTSRSMRSGRSN